MSFSPNMEAVIKKKKIVTICWIALMTHRSHMLGPIISVTI